MNFCEKCYSVVKNVPKGKVITYKKVAELLDSKAHRAVGTCMKNNPYSWASGNPNSGTPCHRVVSSDGKIGSYNGGAMKKIKLLRDEGIEIEVDGKNPENSRIKNFEKYIY